MIRKGRTEFIGISFTLKDGSTEFHPSLPGKVKEDIEQYLNQENMEEIELLEDRVLIETITETVTASGIIIPDTAKEKPMKGRVVAVGPGKKDVEMKLKPDNLVLFGKYSGIEVKLEGKDYLLMRQEDVFMKVSK